MIISTDTETYELHTDGYYYPVLDATKYVLGVIYYENGKHETFLNPQKHYNRIIELHEQCKKKKQQLIIYGHNHNYDLIAYARKNIITDKRLNIITEYNLLAKIEEKTYLADTHSYFPMKLEQAGQIIGELKGTMPKRVKNPLELETYCLQDCKTTLRMITYLKEKLATLGFKPRKLLTAGQTAMTTFLTTTKRNKEYYNLMHKGQILKSENWKKTKVAFRGGHIQCYKTGKYKNCTQLDIRGCYAQQMKTMRFPNLKKYIWINQPDREDYEPILKSIGIVQAEIKIKVEPNHIPFIPIRYKNTTYRPHQAIVKGTWTTHELEYAIQEQQIEILNILWAEIYEDNNVNPFTKYIEKLETIEINEPENKPVIKILRNNLFGKFAQHKTNKLTKFIHRADLPQYLQQGYEVKGVSENLYYIEKEDGEYIPKYSNPLISTLITANARIYLHNLMKKAKHGIYHCNTDGFIINTIDLKEYQCANLIGKNYGKLKIEETGNLEIYGEGKYEIGNKLVINGIPIINRTKHSLTDKTHERTTLVTLSQALYKNQLDLLGKCITTKTAIEPTKLKNKDIPYYIDETKDYY